MSEAERRAAMSDPGMRYLAQQLYELNRRIDATERSARLSKSSVGVALDESDDAPVVDFDLGASVYTAYEASADAATAIDVARFNLGGARYATLADRDAALPSPSNGMRVYVAQTNLDYQFAGGQWVPMIQYVDKGITNQIVNNSDVLAPDADLYFTLVPGIYRVEAFLHMMSDPGADIKVAWTYSGSFNQGGAVRSCIGPALSETTILDTSVKVSGHAFSTVVPYGGTAESSFGTIREDMVLRIATPGVLQLWWAQNVATPSDTTMQYVSRLYVTKVQ